MSNKRRLDLLLIERGLAADIAEARALIGAGQVLVGTRADCKAGTLVALASELRLRKEKSPYVSRSGAKLAGGLRDFSIDPSGWICADIGSSTGGFTDCLLQQGAARVYSVDVGYGLLAWKLRQDPRVVVLERTNARLLSATQIPDPLHLAVIDASFISLQLLLPPLLPLFNGPVRIVALVKPQFELPKEKVGAGGIVREPLLREEALAAISQFAAEIGLICVGRATADICGSGGNQEFLLHFTSAGYIQKRRQNNEAPDFGGASRHTAGDADGSGSSFSG